MSGPMDSAQNLPPPVRRLAVYPANGCSLGGRRAASVLRGPASGRAGAEVVPSSRGQWGAPHFSPQRRCSPANGRPGAGAGCA
eukprot:8001464-Pyramimonas_sp.AAC.1